MGHVVIKSKNYDTTLICQYINLYNKWYQAFHLPSRHPPPPVAHVTPLLLERGRGDTIQQLAGIV
jgi:hypothetical protein